jgi:hypothetical protein
VAHEAPDRTFEHDDGPVIDDESDSVPVAADCLGCNAAAGGAVAT